MESPFLCYTYRDLLRRPGVEIDGLDFGYVDPQVAVDSGASDAQKQAQVPRCPSGTCGQNGGNEGCEMSCVYLLAFAFPNTLQIA